MTTPIKRDTLSDQVVNWVMAYIDTEQLRPNDSLPSVAKLAGQLQVSAPIVREAYKALQGRGIIQIINGKTATVKPLDDAILREFFQRARIFHKDSFKELIELRRGLEIQSAMLAAARRTDAELAQLHALVHRMRAVLPDADAFADLDVEFHLKIADATRNQLLATLINSIRESLRDSILFGLQNRASVPELEIVQAHHEKVLDAIQQQDAARASAAMTAHFDYALAASLTER